MGGVSNRKKHARVSDPIEIPLSAPDKTNLLVMIGARAGRSRASFSRRGHTPGHARKAHKKEESFPGLPSASKPVGAGGNVCSPFQGHALSGAVREDRGLATEHRERRGREPSLLHYQAIRGTKMYHESLSEPSPIILRHEVVLIVSPLCDSHSKHVEKARS